MNRKILSVFMLAIMLASGLTMFANAVTLTVATDKAYYVPGEDVVITGSADAGKAVRIVINNTLKVVFNSSVTAFSNNTYSTKFHLPGNALYGNYTVTASIGSTATAKTSFTVLITQIRELAENLVSTAQRTRARVEAVFAELKYHNITVPKAANDSYTQGVEAEQEALNLLDEGNYNAAIDKALQALQQFNVALRLAKAVEPEEEEEEEEEHEIGPSVAIERAYLFLKRINETANQLKEDEYNITEVSANLDEAEEHLDNATELLNSGDINGSARELATARGILGRTVALLHHVAKGFKLAKTEEFLDQSEKRINDMIEWINGKGRGLTVGEIAACTSALRNAELKLNRIKTRLASGDVDEEMDDLRDAIEDIENGEAQLRNHEGSVLLGEMHKLEVKINVLSGTIERLKKKGVDTTQMEQELQSLQGLLAQIQSKLRDENFDEAKSLLENSEKILENLEGMIGESMHRGSGHGH